MREIRENDMIVVMIKRDAEIRYTLWKERLNIRVQILFRNAIRIGALKSRVHFVVFFHKLDRF